MMAVPVPMSGRVLDEVAPEALGAAIEADGYEMLRLSAPRFDSAALRAALERVRRRFALRERHGDPSYRGICLQTCSDTDNPLYGMFSLQSARARPAIEPTVIAGEFAAVFAALNPHVALDRGRLLELHPGHHMRFHSDGAGSRRLHIPITTEEGCLLDFEAGGSYHLPADGSCFLMNTELCHRARNLSAAPRVHLVFQLRSLAAVRDARSTPKLRATITRHHAEMPLDLVELRGCLASLDWQHANHRYAKAGRIRSRDSVVAADQASLILITEFGTLDDLGDFLDEGALKRLGAALAAKGYRMETAIG
jgi:hypothetical protein